MRKEAEDYNSCAPDGSQLRPTAYESGFNYSFWKEKRLIPSALECAGSDQGMRWNAHEDFQS
jgi:hypothetical protein